MTVPERIRLVMRAQAGDRNRLVGLLRELQGPLRPYISGIGGKTSSEDVVQEALLRIWRDLKWLRDPKLLGYWSYRIATRCSFKCLKKNRYLQADNSGLYTSQ